MNKIFKISLMLLFALLVASCSAPATESKEGAESKEEAEAKEEAKAKEKAKAKEETKAKEIDIFKSDIITNFTTGMEEPEFAISDEDFEKYHGIMNHLHKYPDVEESVLLKELESVYGESTDELLAFMDANQMDAVNRDQGQPSNDVSFDETDAKEHLEMFFDENIKELNLFDFDSDSIEIEVVDNRLGLKGELSYDSNEYDYFIVSEYTKHFQEVNFIGLQIDEEMIDLAD